jgi:hypothetical protein
MNCFGSKFELSQIHHMDMTSSSHASQIHHIPVTSSSQVLWQSAYHVLSNYARAVLAVFKEAEV